MTDQNNFKTELVEKIKDANDHKNSFQITGNNSKPFLGNRIHSEPLSISHYSGINAHEPTELYISARAGTHLTEIETVLSEASQMLAFEPPNFNKESTIGGTIASAMSGPRRPYTGSARDYVLGVECLNGQGELLKFGGKVIKNVAGYDVSRLMTGAMGTLGVLLEITLKVIPMPDQEVAYCMEMDLKTALEKMHTWAAQPLPLTACCYETGFLKLRLSGKKRSLQHATQLMKLNDAEQLDLTYFQQLKNHELPFFTENKKPLWRLSLPSNTRPLALNGECLIDWGGAQRWLRSDEEASVIRQVVSEHGGQATLYDTAQEGIEPFHPLTPEIKKLHHNLKQAFDPNRVLNPGKMYQDL